jgi:HD-like signal output (HDOD) protein
MNKVEIIEDLIKEKYELPTLPGIALKILEAVKKEEPSLKELGDILCADPPLSAKVLRMANSSSYGLTGRTTSVPQAINLLGPNIVKSLALSFSLVKNFQNRNKNHFHYTGFWKRSLTVAITSRKITQEVLPPLTEDAFFLGLLHDIGILFLLQCLAKPYSLVLKEKERTGCSYEEAENQILGLNHMEIGGYLVKTWGLPETFHAPISYHHYPDKSEMEKPEITTLTRVLHLSSLFADFFTYPDKRSSLGPLERYSKEYGLFDNFHVDEAIKQIQRQTTKVFPMFEMKIEAEKHYEEIIESARSGLKVFRKTS